MATGDKSDMLSRLSALMPVGWFVDGYANIRDAVLAGAAQGLAFIYDMLAYVRLQTRISTATDGFLDLIAYDYFGDTLTRKANQTDASFRAWIIANIFRERGTRNAVTKVLEQLTGRTPTIFEPQRPLDTGGYGLGGVGYGVAGGWGSLLYPYQAFVTAYRPTGGGVANVAPYGIPGGDTGGGYGVAGSLEYASAADIEGQITDADIYAAVNSVRPIGYTLWVRISN